MGYAAATGQVVNLNVADLSNGGGGVAGAGVDRKFTIDPTVDRLSHSAVPMSAAALASVAASGHAPLPPRVTRNMLTLPIMDTTEPSPQQQHSHHDKQHRSSKGKRSSPALASAVPPPIVDAAIANTPKALAVIQVINKRDGSFTAEDEALMTSLARGAGVLLRKAQVHEQLVYTQRRTQALLTVLKASERENDVEGVIDTILQVAYDILQAERVRVGTRTRVRPCCERTNQMDERMAVLLLCRADGIILCRSRA